MSNIITNTSRGNVSFRVTLPKEQASNFIKKHGNEVKVEPWGEGWKLSPVKEVQNDSN